MRSASASAGSPLMRTAGSRPCSTRLIWGSTLDWPKETVGKMKTSKSSLHRRCFIRILRCGNCLGSRVLSWLQANGQVVARALRETWLFAGGSKQHNRSTKLHERDHTKQHECYCS